MIQAAIRSKLPCSNGPIKSTIAPLMATDSSFFFSKEYCHCGCHFNNHGLLCWKCWMSMAQISVCSFSEWIHPEIYFLFLTIFDSYIWFFLFHKIYVYIVMMALEVKDLCSFREQVYKNYYLYQKFLFSKTQEVSVFFFSTI